MDSRLQVLLRRYLASNDPLDAVNFVNNLIRSRNDGDVDVKVWVVQAQTDPDGSDLVELHVNANSAYASAANIAATMVGEEMIAYGNDVDGSGPVVVYEQIQEARRRGFFRKAMALYNNTGLPQIEVWDEPVRN